MSLERYISSLQETRAFKDGLIGFQVYEFETVMLFMKKLPPVPRADSNRHILVVEIIGNQPHVRAVLDRPGLTVDTKTSDTEKLMFIFVEMCAHKLSVLSPLGGYRLSDGYTLDVSFDVTYQVSDVEKFWRGNSDPLAELESAIVNAATNFFLKATSNSLVDFPGDAKLLIESHIDASIIKTKEDLEDSVKRSSIPGVGVVQVVAHIDIGDRLREFFERIVDRNVSVGGIYEQKKVDALIMNDKTYHPFDLRTVIREVDISLLGDFYSKSWSEAMSQLAQRISSNKAKYIESLQENYDEMERIVRVGDTLDLSVIDKKIIKDGLAQKLIKISQGDLKKLHISDVEYLEMLLQEKCVESDANSA
jgi:hypothetical protein